MKTAPNRLFPILVSVYGLIYMAGFTIPMFIHEEMIAGAEETSVLIMFLFYMVGLGISWFNEKIGGILLQLWYIGVWFSCFFLWPGSGMIIILAFPGWVLGILMHLSGYKTSGEPVPSPQQQWKFLLPVLMINYVVMYLITMADDLLDDKYLDYLNMPFLLYPVLFIVFAAAFALSWRKEIISGFLLIIWYLILLFGTIAWPLFAEQGPLILVGVVILVQGIFYIVYHYRYKRTSD